MTKVSIDEAKTNLIALIHQLKPGDEILITEDNQPIARLTPAAHHPGRQLGTLKGTVTHMSPDFDAPLDVLKEYMP